MLKNLAARLQQGSRTVAYPEGLPILPDRYLGRPALDPGRCVPGCSAGAEVCPTEALRIREQEPCALTLDLGRCLFCGDCVEACSQGAVTFTGDHRLAVRDRGDLVRGGDEEYRLARALDEKMRKLFGRSLKFRQVSAGGCNACEADINVLTTVVFDLGRFGIQVVASPRHADGLLVTGPVTRNMRLALEKSWQALPTPRLVVALGACAISGGPFAGHPEVEGGAAEVVPVDLFIPGCPPHPLTILDGLLRLLGRLEDAAK